MVIDGDDRISTGYRLFHPVRKGGRMVVTVFRWPVAVTSLGVECYSTDV